MAVQTLETKQVNITIEAGATFQMFFTVRDDNQSLIDLTGCTVEAQLREYPEAQDYFQFTTTHNNSGGRVSVTMQYEDTAAIPYSTGYYDVYITDSSNNREKYIWGEVTVVPAVTKPVAGEIIYLLSFAKEDDFPDVGIVRRIYFSHATNHMYRWNGTAYVSITTDGEAATVEVGTVTTLDPGEDATVENVGSLTNAVLDFGIPKGEKGDPGTTTWEGITNKPETFPPSSHNHDDRYYTEDETDDLLEAKQDTLTFDSTPTANSGNPVTSGGVHTALSGKASSTHSHGSLYGPNGQVTGGNAIANGDYPLIADASNSNKLCYGSSAQFDGSTTTKALSQKGTFESFAKPGDSYTTDEENALLLLKANSADLGDLAYEDDAPSDGKQYARKNGEWAEVQGGSGGGSWGSITGTLSDQTDLQQALDSKADIITASASGSVVSIADGAPYAVDALSVGVDAVQDLHGYDAPWPAGGGKNKLSPFVKGIRLDTTDGSEYTDLNGATTDYIAVDFATGWALSGMSTTLYNFVCAYNASKQFLGRTGATNTASRNLTSTSFISGTPQGSGDIAYLRVTTYVNSSGSIDEVDTLKAQLESGSATSYIPYSNICPITGHSSATVTRTGKNIAIPTVAEYSLYGVTISCASNGEVTINGTATANITSTTQYFSQMKIPSGTYSIISDYWSEGNIVRVQDMDSNTTIASCTSANTVFTFSVSKPTNIRIFMRIASGTAFSNQKIHYCLARGNYATLDYETPNIQQVTIDLGSTVYGALVDVPNGAMRVTHQVVDMGDLTWSSMSSFPNVCSSSINGKADGQFNMICSQYKISDVGALANIPDFSIVGNTTGYGIFVKDSRYSDATTFKTAVTGQKIVYPLAEPIEVTLTPAQISTLLGSNVIWADTGDIENVTYRADTALYIDRKVAEANATTRAMIADSATADGKAPKSLSTGDLIIVGDELRKATANIGSGNAITASNSTTANLADVIKALQ